MDNKMGIKETKEVIDAVLGVVKLGQEVLADGKINSQDLSIVLAHAPSLAQSIHAAVDGIDKVLPELKDLDGSEAAELATHVMAKLSIDNAKAMLIAEKSLKTAIAVLELGKAIAMPNEVISEEAAPESPVA